LQLGAPYAKPMTHLLVALARAVKKPISHRSLPKIADVIDIDKKILLSIKINS